MCFVALKLVAREGDTGSEYQHPHRLPARLSRLQQLEDSEKVRSHPQQGCPLFP